MKYLNLLLAPILWSAFLCLRTVFILLGYILIPIAAFAKAHKVRESKVYPNKIVKAFTWWFMQPWGNEEEGIGWYGDPKWPTWRRIIYSEAIRNPANNLRFAPIISLKIDPDKVDFIGSLGDKKTGKKEDIIKYDEDKYVFWYFAWQGLYSNFRVHFNLKGKRYRFWLGWKVYPEDIYGLPDWSHRKARAGFATQLKRIDHWVQ